MYHKKSLLLDLLLVGIVISFVLTSVPIGILAETTDETKILESVEIREYEGKDLSSIDDFFENSIKGPQYIAAENYTLTVSGLVNNELEFTYDDVVNDFQHFEKVVTLYCVEGWNTTILWEGIHVKDLLADAQVDPSANTVIFYAYDGYSTSMPLDYIIDNNIIIAYKMNNVTFHPKEAIHSSLWQRASGDTSG